MPSILFSIVLYLYSHNLNLIPFILVYTFFIPLSSADPSTLNLFTVAQNFY